MTPWMRRALAPALLAAPWPGPTLPRRKARRRPALSLLPVASVVVTSGRRRPRPGAVVALPVALVSGGAVLTVQAVQASAMGTVIVLERASDGAQASLELTGRAASANITAGHGGGVQRDRHRRHPLGGGRGAGLCAQRPGPRPAAQRKAVTMRPLCSFLGLAWRCWPLPLRTPRTRAALHPPAHGAASSAACNWRSKPARRWTPAARAWCCWAVRGKTSGHGLRYSHLGWAYKSEAGPWRVVHKLNDCHSAVAAVYRQGLGNFPDDLWRYEAVGRAHTEVQARLLPVLQSNAQATPQLHVRPYNLVSYAWGERYQQSNQWAIETLAAAMEPASVRGRAQAQAWLRLKGYEPSVLKIGPLTRLGGRATAANIAFDDHPPDKRFANRIETVTVDSVLAWLQRAQLAARAQRIHLCLPDTACQDAQ